MSPLRVLLIAPSMRIVGGQAVQAERLLENLRLEKDVDVRFLPIDPQLPGPLRLLQRIKYVRTVATFAWYGLRLAFAAPRADVIHTFAAGFYSFLLGPAPALVLGRLLGKPTVLNYRDGRAEDHLEWRSSALIRRATRVVTPSGYLVDVFAKHGIAAQSIPNIIDGSRFRYRERTDPQPRFLHNRGLEDTYNVGCSLRAFGLVQQQVPDASLVVAHDGPLRSELESLARKLSLRNVSFVGKVSQDRLPELLDEADVYLTSPNRDNMPGSLLECFAAGLPIVATRTGGIPYITEDGETALLTPLDDPQAMAQAALRLLAEPGLAGKLSRNGRRELEKYSWSAVGPQWLEVYGELADRS